MSKLIYSRNGSETTESIDNASPMIKAIWSQAHGFGANIVRVRAEKKKQNKENFIFFWIVASVILSVGIILSL